MPKICRLCFVCIVLTFHASCSDTKQSERAIYIQEVIDVESEFARMASDSGISEAFLAFAADDGVLLRGKDMVKGKKAMKHRFDSLANPNKMELEWSPDFIDVSESGDLAYTYGKYFLSVWDSAGVQSNDTGIFHTVWKRQKDGQWKFVWD